MFVRGFTGNCHGSRESQREKKVQECLVANLCQCEMSFSIDYFFKCYYKLVKAKKKKFNVCIKKKKYFHLECTHQHSSRVIWNHAFFSLFIAMCVHGAVGCDVMACRGKLKFQLLSRFFLRLFFSRSCNTKEKKKIVCNIKPFNFMYLSPFPFLSQHFSSCQFHHLVAMAAVNKNLVFHLRITRRHRDHLNVYNRQTMDKLTYLVQFNTRCVFMHKRMSTRIRKGIWPRQLKSKRREREQNFKSLFFEKGTEN